MNVEILKYIETCKKQQQEIRLTPIEKPLASISTELNPKILTIEKRYLIIQCCGIDPLTGCVFGSISPCIIEKNYRELWEIYQSRTRHPDYRIDHINGCDFDNSIWNLREITITDNRKNRKPYYQPVPSHYWENTLPPIPLEYFNKGIFPVTLPFASITKIFEHYSSSIQELVLLALQYTEMKSLCITDSEEIQITQTNNTTQTNNPNEPTNTTTQFTPTTIKEHFIEEANYYNTIRLKQIKSNLHKDLFTY